YTFLGASGWDPAAALVLDKAGNLYGTTAYGGANTKTCTSNFPRICGLVFKLDSTGKKETVLYKFKGPPGDGMNPFYRPAIPDGAGRRVSTTGIGGYYGYGTVFRLGPAGKETILHNFAGPPGDGEGAVGGVIRDAAGNLYGSTGSGGGYSNGAVYEVDSNGV